MRGDSRGGPRAWTRRPPLFVAHGPSYQWGAELELELQAAAAAPTLALQAPSSPSIQASRYYADQ